MRSAPIQYLFAGNRLAEVLSGASNRALDALASWPADDLLSIPEADLVRHLTELARLETPALARDEVRLESPAEVLVDATDWGRHFQATVTRFTLVVPVTGDPSMFGMTASRLSGGSLLGEIDRSAGTLRLHCNNPDSPAQARAYFERTLDEIEQRLAWTRAEIYLAFLPFLVGSRGK
jgi:hypothetical protein